jgi:hypothetical protein
MLWTKACVKHAALLLVGCLTVLTGGRASGSEPVLPSPRPSGWQQAAPEELAGTARPLPGDEKRWAAGPMEEPLGYQTAIGPLYDPLGFGTKVDRPFVLSEAG